MQGTYHYVHDVVHALCGHVIPGSAADICKVAMIAVTAMLAEESPRSRLVLEQAVYCIGWLEYGT